MLKRIGLGLIFALLTTLYYAVMLTSIDSFNTSYKTVIIPKSLYGIAFAFIVPTSLEFTIVQCPHEMICGMQHLDLVISLALMGDIHLIPKNKHIVRVYTIMY